jgi:hypothetical protein
VFKLVGFLGSAAHANESAKLGLVLAQPLALFSKAISYASSYE